MPEGWRIVKAKHSGTAFSGEGAARTGGHNHARHCRIVIPIGKLLPERSEENKNRGRCDEEKNREKCICSRGIKPQSPKSPRDDGKCDHDREDE